MIINNLGINFAGGGGGVDAKLESKDYNLTANGSTAIRPSSGYDGISGGTIQVNVDMAPAYNSGYTEGYSSGYTSGETDGYASGYTSGETDGYQTGYSSGYTSGSTDGYATGYASGETAGIAEQKALLTSTAITENGSYTSENGFSAVTVDVQAGGENKLNKFLTNTLTAVTQSDLSGITAIREYMFYGYSNLKSVDLPASVIGLFSHSFHGSGIETLDVSKVTGYGSNTFLDCKSLTGLTGFENYTSWPTDSMFEGCTALTGDFITNMIVDSYSHFKRVFRDCRSLRSVTWLKNQPEVTYNSASSNGYAGCTSMEYLDYTHNMQVPQLRFVNPFTAFTANYEIRVPEALYDSWTAATNWNNSAIVGHIKAYPGPYPTFKLKYTTTGSDITPTVPYTSTVYWGGIYMGTEFDAATGGTVSLYGDNVVIASRAYYNVTSITSFEIPDGITSIGGDAFNGCTSLSSVTIPDSVTSIGGAAFAYCTSLSSITCNATVAPTLDTRVFSSVQTNGTLYVPAGSDYSSWLAQLPSGWRILPNTYADCQITTDAANDTVKIGYTYNDLAALADVLVDGVSVKSGLVDDTYTFADAGTHIVRYVYTGESATQVTRQVYRLQSFSASTGVLTIDDNALNMYQSASSSELASIYLPNVRTIGYQGITNTIATDIYAPNVVGLGVKALQFNPLLDPVSLSIDKLQSIGNNAFRQSAIKEAHFGPSLNYWDYSVFNECYSLSALTFDSATSGLTDMPSVGDKTYALTEIVFPDCITGYCQNSMSYGMITNSTGLTSVTFGSGATTMNGLIFKGDVSALTEINCKASAAPSIITGCFGPVTANTGTLYVPAGSDYSTWAAELGSNWTVSDTL